jgi:hypothetical protein
VRNLSTKRNKAFNRLFTAYLEASHSEDQIDLWRCMEKVIWEEDFFDVANTVLLGLISTAEDQMRDKEKFLKNNIELRDKFGKCIFQMRNASFEKISQAIASLQVLLKMEEN